MNTLIPGVIGIVLLAGFLGTMLAKVPAIPLIVIALGVGALLVCDFVLTLREDRRNGK